MCFWLGKHRRMIINIFNCCWLAGLEILYGLVWILMNSKNSLPRNMEYLDRLQKEVFWIFGKPPKKFFCCACQHIHLTFSDRCIFVKNIVKFPKTSKVKLYQNSSLLRLSISCALRELCALHAVNISGKDPPTSLQSPLSKIQTKPSLHFYRSSCHPQWIGMPVDLRRRPFGSVPWSCIFKDIWREVGVLTQNLIWCVISYESNTCL